MRLRLRRGRQRQRLDRNPGINRHRGGGQRDRRCPGGLGQRHLRPVGIRWLDSRPAVPLLDRRSCPGAGHRSAFRLLHRRDRHQRQRPGDLHGRCGAGRQRLDARRLLGCRRVVHHAPRQLLHRVVPDVRVVRPVPQDGPYNFGFPGARPDFVEHFPYQDGLLISYWDTSFSDNNTSEHPGGGEVLPIDANPRPIYKLDGKPWRNRIQGYDATFGLQKSDSFTLHDQATGQASYIRGQSAKPVFDDTDKYWYNGPNETVFHGIDLPAVGVKIKVVDQGKTTMTIRIS